MYGIVGSVVETEDAVAVEIEYIAAADDALGDRTQLKMRRSVYMASVV